MDVVATEERLRELIGVPQPHVRDKVRASLGERHREWLASSPLCLMATCDADGRFDVSPKGDPPGFTKVLDDTTVAIPERAGNRRADGFVNLLSNPRIGLIHLIPGRGDTLRINGSATVVSDAPFFDEMVVLGHRPRLATVVRVEEVFFHCPKAFMRSKVWQPQTWEPQAVPSRARITQSMERQEESLESLEEYYGPQYARGLYPPDR